MKINLPKHTQVGVKVEFGFNQDLHVEELQLVCYLKHQS